MTPDKKKHLSNINFSKDAADYDQSQSYAMLRASVFNDYRRGFEQAISDCS